MAISSASTSTATLNFPPGYRFNPTPCEIFRYYLYDRVNDGHCRWNENQTLIKESVDILAHQPWDLPGMDSVEKEAFYYYVREKKSKAAAAGISKKRNNSRVVKGNQGHWRVCQTENIQEKIGPPGNKQELLWGTKSLLNYYTTTTAASKARRTEWLMHEFVLDSKLAKNNDNSVGLCKVYKKKDTKDQKGGEPSAYENNNTNAGSDHQVLVFAEIPEEQRRPLKRERAQVLAPATSESCCGTVETDDHCFVDPQIQHNTYNNYLDAAAFKPPAGEYHHVEEQRQPLKRQRVLAPTTSDSCCDTVESDDHLVDPQVQHNTYNSLDAAAFQPPAGDQFCLIESDLKQELHPPATQPCSSMNCCDQYPLASLSSRSSPLEVYFPLPDQFLTCSFPSPTEGIWEQELNMDPFLTFDDLDNFLMLQEADPVELPSN